MCDVSWRKNNVHRVWEFPNTIRCNKKLVLTENCTGWLAMVSSASIGRMPAALSFNSCWMRSISEFNRRNSTLLPSKLGAAVTGELDALAVRQEHD